MRKSNLSSAKIILFLLSVLVIGLISCEKKEDPIFSNPEISIEGDDLIEVKRGTAFDVVLKLNAEGGNQELLVYKNGGLLESVPLSSEASSYTYSNQSIPEDAVEGEEFEYEFSLVNTQNVESEKVRLTISTLAYDPIDVGGHKLYELDVPEDGIVEENYKLVKGRNYYIPSTMKFQDGTSFTIEEGVKVYLKSDAEPSVDIVLYEGSNVEIAGTAVNPVVFTSENELTGSGGVPGDWGVFNIKGDGVGTNSGSIHYLRLEFGGDRNFRLQNVGSGSDIDHVQVFKAAGVGIMPTDGDVNLKYIIATDCTGGGYRLGDEFSGNMQFGISHISETFGDNVEVQIRETASPVLSNFTIIGPGEESDNTTGIRMRTSSSGKIYNTIIAEFPRRGLRLNDAVIVTDLDGPTVFAYSYIFHVGKDPYRDDTENGNLFQGYIDDDGVFQNPFYNNVTGLDDKGDPVLVAISGISPDSLIPDDKQVSDFDPALIDDFFSAAPYVGAIADASDLWPLNWAKKPDGTLWVD